MIKGSSSAVVLAAALALSAAALTGCAGPDLHAAARANAACLSALRPQLPAAELPDLDELTTHVVQHHQSWSIDGQLASNGRQVRCHVVNDSSDQVRGMRVDHTWVGPIPS